MGKLALILVFTLVLAFMVGLLPTLAVVVVALGLTLLHQMDK